MIDPILYSIVRANPCHADMGWSQMSHCIGLCTLSGLMTWGDGQKPKISAILWSGLSWLSSTLVSKAGMSCIIYTLSSLHVMHQCPMSTAQDTAVLTPDLGNARQLMSCSDTATWLLNLSRGSMFCIVRQ